MKRKVLTVLEIFIALICFAGCATMSDVVKYKNEGISEVYPVTAEQAWEIAKAVFQGEGSEDIEEHREEGYLLTSIEDLSTLSLGSVMGVWIEPVDEYNTKVTVVTKRRLSITPLTTLTEATFHKLFAQGVNSVKSRRSLPSAPQE